MVAVEIAANPTINSRIDDLVTANLEKIKTNQLSKQYDLPSNKISGNSNYVASDCRTFTPTTTTPYDSLESDQRSYNANVHIEEQQQLNLNRNSSSPICPVNDAPNITIGGTTHFDTTPFQAINLKTQNNIHYFDSISPLISILNELDEVLKQHMAAANTNTNPINTNHKLTADTELLFDETNGVIDAINHCIVDNQIDSSIDDDNIRKKLIPGRVGG